MLVEPVVFVKNGHIGCFKGWDIPERIPHDFKVVVHLSAATHKEALGDILAAVAASAGKLQLFQQMDMLAFHLTVTNQIERCRQTGKSCANDIRRFLVHIFRFFGVCKRFISSCGIIHNDASLCKSSCS